MTCEVRNVVCTFDLGKAINLAEVAMALLARYEPDVFPAIVSYSKRTCTSAQVFATGKVVIVGCASQDHGMVAAHDLVLMLQLQLELDTSVLNFHVRNIVLSINLGHGLDLARLFDDVSNWRDLVVGDEKGEGGPAYDKTRFPGLTFAVTDDRGRVITMAMFDTGKGVGTGLKTLDQIRTVERIMRERMHAFRKDAGLVDGCDELVVSLSREWTRSANACL